jgi:hypothetical protein
MSANVGLAAFGLGLIAKIAPPGAWEERSLCDPCLEIRSVSAEAIEHEWSGEAEAGWQGFIDGAPFLVQRGVEGDHRFVHGVAPDAYGVPRERTRAVHHLSGDAGVLRCAPSNSGDLCWWRVVLDSVLFTVALLNGYEALHAGAIASGAGTIAIAAAAGGGKSTLLCELLRRGSVLMADDVLVLESQGASAPLAHPAPPLMTVPSARVHACGAEHPEAICSLADECWIAVPVHDGPLPLKALVVLDRLAVCSTPSPGPQVSLTRIEAPLAPLLDSLMGFPHAPERQRGRFELASTLASTSGLWRLSATADTPPEVLADVLLEGELWT